MQITYTLPKEKWQNIIIKENNDPVVFIKPSPNIIPANTDIKIRKQLISMLENAANNLPDNICLYIVEGIRSIEKQEQQWNECYRKTQEEFPNKDIVFLEKQTGLLVAKPSPLANHNCGGAIDVTLMYKDSGEFVDMGTPIQSSSGYRLTQMFSEEISNIQKQNRKILRESMEKVGFVWYPGEWWHYCYGDRMWAVYTDKEECFYGPVLGMKNIISNIQDRLIKLLTNTGKVIKEASIDNCSEVSRLVAIWIFNQMPNVNIKILKGDNVLNTTKSHDILTVFYEDKIFILDPTIFQFEDVQNILMFELDKTSDYLSIVQKRYGGDWKVSENLIPGMYIEGELLNIIYENLEII